MTDTAFPRTAAPIELPSPAPPTRRGPLPLIASIVPIVGAVVMWLVTGSAFMLLFAALGPLMAVAALADAARVRRRERRAAARELDEACERAEGEIARRHEAERRLLEAARPDVVTLADERAPWTRGPDELVLGLGRVASAVRVSGGEGERAERLRARAERIDHAPVAVPAVGGVCVQGEPIAARAVARALLMQLCLRAGPGELSVVAVPAEEDAAFAALPHRRSQAPLRAALTWGAAPAGAADIVIAAVSPREPVPVGCARVLELEPDRPLAGRVLDATAAAAGEPVELVAEALSAGQARELCEALAGRVSGGVPAPLALGELADPPASDRGLAAVIGRGVGGDVVVDLVADGPHAVVVGMTGAGKSELLTTWVASLSRRLGPDRVTFLLADFKGGTAFEALAGLPHVAGVVTDLDGAGARRAVESLRAELRRREGELARIGARDVADPRVAMPRLVIVVDEFAALLQDHGDLSALFTDIAARGRALGMHLILGTQRAAGVFRDSLLANCPLRVALRVTDASDSRLVIGTDGAATLPGDAASRGIALVRRAGDAAPVTCRIARTGVADLAAIGPGSAAPDAPWLPPLPGLLPLAELRAQSDAPPGILLGLADEPDRQRQEPVLLRHGVDRGVAVIGAGGTGKSAAVRLIADQTRPGESLIVPPDAEAAWDAVELALRAAPAVVAIDDVDALLGRYPAEYAGELLARLETLARDAGARRSMLVCTAARASGPVARLLDLLPRRVILPLPSRADHVAAGGEGAEFAPGRGPGRAVIDGREVQLAWPGEPRADGAPAPADAIWHPAAPVTGLIVRGAASRAAGFAQSWGRGVRVVALDGLEPGARLDELTAGSARVAIAGDGDTWLRHATLLRDVRRTGELVFGAECAAELRTIAGERDLPPYARPRASRAWRVVEGAAPERVVLP
ncbi:FtsK/SpoIIIE domain-containing protein [Microbacterium sediminis]|uniref:Uncharacterized protein n=1 Tax=Microbacterium sediminis TaxID=904291 RepID=A0A1B9NCI1_9MICO|nr:FtsK/SpoIIIE domain-containing protein [Microbacterium sediminis]OCG74311.1 hypothetical protein A7J15_05585 [Microbacterium sediminis]QBR73675.1 cell division protein FtsK [Microbacterium sediminis]